MPKVPRSPMKIAIYAGLIALVVTLLATAMLTIFALPDRSDPEKFGEACGQTAFFVALVTGVIAYVRASRRQRT